MRSLIHHLKVESSCIRLLLLSRDCQEHGVMPVTADRSSLSPFHTGTSSNWSGLSSSDMAMYSPQSAVDHRSFFCSLIIGTDTATLMSLG